MESCGKTVTVCKKNAKRDGCVEARWDFVQMDERHPSRREGLQQRRTRKTWTVQLKSVEGCEGVLRVVEHHRLKALLWGDRVRLNWQNSNRKNWRFVFVSSWIEMCVVWRVEWLCAVRGSRAEDAENAILTFILQINSLFMSRIFCYCIQACLSYIYRK